MKTTIILPEPLLRKAQKQAKKKGLSLAAYVRTLLIKDLEEAK